MQGCMLPLFHLIYISLDWSDSNKFYSIIGRSNLFSLQIYGAFQSSTFLVPFSTWLLYQRINEFKWCQSGIVEVNCYS